MEAESLAETLALLNVPLIKAFLGLIHDDPLGVGVCTIVFVDCHVLILAIPEEPVNLTRSRKNNKDGIERATYKRDLTMPIL